MKWLRMTVMACLVAAAGAFALVRFAGREVRQLTNQVSQLMQDKDKLLTHIQKLGTTRRRAQVDVLGQTQGQDGVPRTTLRWQEITETDVLGPPRMIEVEGQQVYVEAFVIKFKPSRHGGELEQRPSVAVFRRIFGDRQTPESGYPLTTRPEEPVSDTSTKESTTLWARFWRVATDPKEAEALGVRVAQCEAPAARMSPGQTWEVTLDVAGGLNVRLLRTQPAGRDRASN